MNQDLYRRFLDRAGLEKPDDVQILRAIRDIPHGRPSQRTAEAVLTDWRGTCSSKLLLLRKILPHLQLRFYNRVFRLTPEMARSIMGTDAAAVIPPEGMIDVHTFATGIVNGKRITIDLTFPGTPWDGESHMQIPWTEGVDHEAGEDFISHKELLVAQFGDPAAREKLIAAISK